ncbi:MAG: precorrin-6A synthase (deacetylating) [Solirubrobacteraceae bacterium]
MRRVSVIGIGAGDPDDVTVAAIKALNAADVFFVIDKPGPREDLARLRREIIERYVTRTSQRTVGVADPERDRRASAYAEAVEDWRRRRADVWEALIRDELADDETGAFLVWGDPALYDSTIAVLDRIAARRTVAFEFAVIPGISSVAALTARHRIALNRVGEAVQITTGRRLAQGLPTDGADVVVMLDADCAFRTLADRDLDVYWGAYIGTDDEILVSGRLADVADEIVRVRGEARERKGWIMDTYLLRRPDRS